MKPKVASRAEIAPFYVMEVMKAAAERAATGAGVLHLEVGQPSTPAPAGVRAAAHAAIDADRLGYTDAVGIPQLRARIARHYRDEYGVTVDPGRILVTVGASGACVLAFLASFDVGDRVGVTEPGYPCYRNMLRAFGIEPVAVPVAPSSRFQPTVDALEAAAPLDGLVIASPANPTGSMLSATELLTISGWSDANGVQLVSDEIYHGITYGEPAPTALAGGGTALVVNSFSKYFSMTGWRVGWLVAPEEMLVALERLAQNIFISVPTVSQHAALAAFDCRDELDGNVARYARNREVLLRGLATAGIDRLAPADGAFYVYADVGHLTDDSQQLCRQWLDELGIAVTSGVDFDPSAGNRFVRFSYSGTTDDMGAAMTRIAGWVSSH